MRFRLLALFLIAVTACVFLVLLLARWGDHGPMSLAQLSPVDDGASASAILDQLEQSVRDAGVWLSSFKVESIFYGALGVCGILLALQAVVSAFRMVKDGKAREQLGPGIRTTAKRSSPASSFRRHRQWLPYNQSLTGRMIVSFTGLVGAFGLLAIVAVYFTLTVSLRRHAIHRARVTAVNISDSASGYLLKKNSQVLREMLRKQAKRPEVAYVLVQNNANKIIAHSFAAVVPQELQSPSTVATSESERTLHIGDAPVYEVSAPILEGQIGTVRVGLWRNEIEAAISRTVSPLMEILLAVVVGGMLIAVYLAWRINRPIIRLVRAARMISGGDLDAPSFGTSDKTEFGELARALERMRSSIKAALTRLTEEHHS